MLEGTFVPGPFGSVKKAHLNSGADQTNPGPAANANTVHEQSQEMNQTKEVDHRAEVDQREEVNQNKPFYLQTVSFEWSLCCLSSAAPFRQTGGARQ